MPISLSPKLKRQLGEQEKSRMHAILIKYVLSRKPRTELTVALVYFNKPIYKKKKKNQLEP